MKLSPKLTELFLEILHLDVGSVDNIAIRVRSGVVSGTKKTKVTKDNIYSLVTDVVQSMRNLGCSDVKIRKYQLWGFAPILFWFANHHVNAYDEITLENLSDVMHTAFREGKFSQTSLGVFRHSIGILQAYRKNGTLQKDDIPQKIERKLGKDFEELIAVYRTKCTEFQADSKKTISRKIGGARAFLYYLEQGGIFCAKELNHALISETITGFAPSYKGGLKTILRDIKTFLKFLYEVGVTADDYSEAVPPGAVNRIKVRYGFSNAEVAAILSKVDRDSSIGKRDYAMMLIAARIGLRVSDIANLCYKDIDWRTKEIKIVQRKTGIGVSLPLTAEVGNAIADYMLNARPNVEKLQIFRNVKKPYDPISVETIGLTVARYLNQ